MDELLADILLRLARLGEEHDLAAAFSVRDRRARRRDHRSHLRVDPERFGALSQSLYLLELDDRGLTVECPLVLLIGDERCEQLLVVEVFGGRERGRAPVVDTVLEEHSLQPRLDVEQAGCEGSLRGGHPPVEAEEQERPMAPSKRLQAWSQEVASHVLVERPLLGGHRELVGARGAADERFVEKLLRLTTQRPLYHLLESAPKLASLPGREVAIVRAREHGAEGGEIAQEGAAGIDVLHERPQLRE